MIAECLGLDPGSYASQTHADDSDAEETCLKSQLSDDEKYRTAEAWMVTCPECGVDSEYKGVVRTAGGEDAMQCGMVCPNTACAKPYPGKYLCNVLTEAIRSHINRYYKVYRHAGGMH